MVHWPKIKNEGYNGVFTIKNIGIAVHRRGEMIDVLGRNELMKANVSSIRNLFNLLDIHELILVCL